MSFMVKPAVFRVFSCGSWLKMIYFCVYFVCFVDETGFLDSGVRFYSDLLLLTSFASISKYPKSGIHDGRIVLLLY